MLPVRCRGWRFGRRRARRQGFGAHAVLHTAAVGRIAVGSCRRMAEKAQRNIRLEAVEKARRQGLSGAEIVLRVKNGTGHKLKLEKASLTVYYAGGVVTKVALREPAEAPRRATASVTTLWRIRTSDPMALHVMTKKIREDDISKIGVSFAIEGRGGPRT